jgi:hypothetical protein
VRNVENASAVKSYFAPTHAIGITRDAALPPSCRAAGKPPAHWLAAPEKRDYFVDHSMSFWSGRGDRAIPATGASGSLPTSRYKITHWRKGLILKTKNPILQTGRYKRILSGQPAVLISLIALISGTLLQDRPHHGPFATA